MRIASLLAAVTLLPTLLAAPQEKIDTTKHLSIPDVIARFEQSIGLVTCFSAQNDVISQGSGFFVSEDGKFTTNFHVVAEADHITVKRSDGGSYSVTRTLSVDVTHDLALLQVSGRKFQPAPLGNSKELRVGDTAIAVGSPLALESTASTGIISGFRELDGFKLIQTTTPISRGSSGGALLNSRGEVVGVTSYAISAGQNLNFAIPVEYVRAILKTPHASSTTGLKRPEKSSAIDVAPRAPQEPIKFPARQNQVSAAGKLLDEKNGFRDVKLGTLVTQIAALKKVPQEKFKTEAIHAYVRTNEDLKIFASCLSFVTYYFLHDRLFQIELGWTETMRCKAFDILDGFRTAFGAQLEVLDGYDDNKFFKVSVGGEKVTFVATCMTNSYTRSNPGWKRPFCRAEFGQVGVEPLIEAELRRAREEEQKKALGVF